MSTLFDDPTDGLPPVLTARACAKIIELRIEGRSPGERHDTLRRRVQESQLDHDLLEIVSDDGNRTTYRITGLGMSAVRALERGEKPGILFNPAALVRKRDRNPSHKAARNLRPDSDFHHVLLVFAGRWS